MTISEKQPLTTDEAAGRSREDAGALQALRVGTGGADSGLEAVRMKPAGQPLQLAVAQEAVALEEAEEGSGREVSEYVTSWERNKT